MAYFSAIPISYAMCGVHLLCELTGIYKNYPEQKWESEMLFHLLNMYRIVEVYNQNPEAGSR